MKPTGWGSFLPFGLGGGTPPEAGATAGAASFSTLLRDLTVPIFEYIPNTSDWCDWDFPYMLMRAHFRGYSGHSRIFHGAGSSPRANAGKGDIADEWAEFLLHETAQATTIAARPGQ